MTKEERKRLAAHHAVAPLNVPPTGHPKSDQPDDPDKAEEEHPPTRFSNASHHS